MQSQKETHSRRIIVVLLPEIKGQRTREKLRGLLLLGALLWH